MILASKVEEERIFLVFFWIKDTAASTGQEKVLNDLFNFDEAVFHSLQNRN